MVSGRYDSRKGGGGNRKPFATVKTEKASGERAFLRGKNKYNCFGTQR